MARGRRALAGAAWLAGFLLASSALAEDWPTYMHDAERSGVSGEALPLPLEAAWTYVPPAEPTRAWPATQMPARRPELPKVDFDDAFHVAMAGDAVYFGSSVDNAIHAIDAAAGTRRWVFFTGGPVRLAPTVAAGRIFAGSDDGSAYCIDANDGRLVWKTQPMDGETRILGAGRMMSLWPVRTGVLVDRGVAYCGAGLFPSRGAALFALDAASGRPIWKTTQGRKDAASSPLSPQGYLLLSADQLYAPCGRGKPLVYARADGILRAAIAKGVQLVHDTGGGYGVLVDDLYYVGTQNTLHAYRPDGEHAAEIRDARRLVATSNSCFTLSTPLPRSLAVRREALARGSSVSAFDRAVFDRAARAGAVRERPVRWTFERPGLQTIIAVGRHVVIGGSNEVIALEATTGREAWTARVDGLAKGLAFAHGRLVVSTDKGRIHCFSRDPPAANPAQPSVAALPAAADRASPAELAEAIARDAGVARGYALVVAADGARLAYELAKRTGLLVHVVEPDSARATQAREALWTAGAYGTQVVVDVVPPGATNGLPYPPYLANVIVADGGTADMGAATAREILRVLKPCGGVLYARVKVPDAAWLKAGAATPLTLAGTGGWMRIVRGRLPGARDWTHQYADAGNSGSSDDERVRGMPEVLWYGEPGPDKMQETHLRSEAPLVFDGRVFVQGLRAEGHMPLLLSFDAYNGVPAWERPMPGAERLNIIGDCGNLACSERGLFVVTGARCHQLDRLTGETRSVYALPAGTAGATGAWAYVAVEGDTLVGTSSAGEQFSDAVFAYDLNSGRLKWRHGGSIVRNSTIALHDGKVFLVEHRGQARAPVAFNAPAAARADQNRRYGIEVTPGQPEPYVRTVVALDLASGKPAWEREVELTGCGAWVNELVLMAKRDVVLLCGVYWVPSDSAKEQRRMLALSGTDGATLWDRTTSSLIRPVLAGDRVLGVPNAFELRTGTPVTRSGPKGDAPWQNNAQIRCGQMSASAGMLFYRSGSTVMKDVDTGEGLALTGLRPGCLINIIPAGGVIVQTAGDSGCTCPYPLQATVTFVPPVAE